MDTGVDAQMVRWLREGRPTSARDPGRERLADVCPDKAVSVERRLPRLGRLPSASSIDSSSSSSSSSGPASRFSASSSATCSGSEHLLLSSQIDKWLSGEAKLIMLPIMLC